MAVNSTGFNESAAQAAIQNVIAGGAEIHLIGGGDTMAYQDTATELDNKSAEGESGSQESETVAEDAFSIETPTDFSGTAILKNDNDVAFGTPAIGVVNDVVVANQSSRDLMIVGNEPNNPDLTGEEVTLPADTTLYELGNA